MVAGKEGMAMARGALMCEGVAGCRSMGGRRFAPLEESMSPTELVREVQTRYPSKCQIEAAIGYLKEQGYDRADSMVVLQRVYGMSPNESKLFIHHSEAWELDRLAVEKLHEQLDENLQ